jgi:hypothetical protein
MVSFVNIDFEIEKHFDLLKSWLVPPSHSLSMFKPGEKTQFDIWLFFPPAFDLGFKIRIRALLVAVFAFLFLPDSFSFIFWFDFFTRLSNLKLLQKKLTMELQFQGSSKSTTALSPITFNCRLSNFTFYIQRGNSTYVIYFPRFRMYLKIHKNMKLNKILAYFLLFFSSNKVSWYFWL